MIGARVLAHHKNEIGVIEIFQSHRPLADAERLREAHATGLVTHIRAIREIIGPQRAPEKLIEKGSFIAGATRSIEYSLVRVLQRFEGRANLAESFFPDNRYVAIARRIVP